MFFGMFFFFCFFFFFSSRRRHTRSTRDWSSDVCSSDLGFLACMYELQEMLKDVTGMKAVSLTPLAGAQGEFAGVAMIRAYHVSRNDRSEEHTSELQSRVDLVCRLLLEKKKRKEKNKKNHKKKNKKITIKKI